MRTFICEFRNDPSRIQIPRGAVTVPTNTGAAVLKFGTPASLPEPAENAGPVSGQANEM